MRYYDIAPKWLLDNSPFESGYNYAFYLSHPHKLVRDIYNRVKWFIQRGRRGWSDCDCWGLFDYNARIMSEMLNRLARESNGTPCDLTIVQWQEILEEIKRGFECVKALDDCYDQKERDKLMRQYNRGMDLLKEYYFNLWD